MGVEGRQEIQEPNIGRILLAGDEEGKNVFLVIKKEEEIFLLEFSGGWTEESKFSLSQTTAELLGMIKKGIKVDPDHLLTKLRNKADHLIELEKQYARVVKDQF